MVVKISVAVHYSSREAHKANSGRGFLEYSGSGVAPRLLPEREMCGVKTQCHTLLTKRGKVMGFSTVINLSFDLQC